MSRSALAALVVILVAGPAAPAPRLKEKTPAAPYWSVRVGATLRYQLDAGGESTEVVTAVDKTGDVTRVVSHSRKPDGTTAPEWTVEVRPAGLFLVEQVGRPYDPPMQLLRFPVKVGDQWETAYGQGGQISRLVRTVTETKALDTPAGRFEAVRILSGTPDQPDNSKSVIWYSPQIGIVQTERLRVLKAYTPGK